MKQLRVATLSATARVFRAGLAAGARGDGRRFRAGGGAVAAPKGLRDVAIATTARRIAALEASCE